MADNENDKLSQIKKVFWERLAVKTNREIPEGVQAVLREMMIEYRENNPEGAQLLWDLAGEDTWRAMGLTNITDFDAYNEKNSSQLNENPRSLDATEQEASQLIEMTDKRVLDAVLIAAKISGTTLENLSSLIEDYLHVDTMFKNKILADVASTIGALKEENIAIEGLSPNDSSIREMLYANDGQRPSLVSAYADAKQVTSTVAEQAAVEPAEPEQADETEAFNAKAWVDSLLDENVQGPRTKNIDAFPVGQEQALADYLANGEAQRAYDVLKVVLRTNSVTPDDKRVNIVKAIAAIEKQDSNPDGFAGEMIITHAVFKKNFYEQNNLDLDSLRILNAAGVIDVEELQKQLPWHFYHNEVEAILDMFSEEQRLELLNGVNAEELQPWDARLRLFTEQGMDTEEVFSNSKVGEILDATTAHMLGEINYPDTYPNDDKGVPSVEALIVHIVNEGRVLQDDFFSERIDIANSNISPAEKKRLSDINDNRYLAERELTIGDKLNETREALNRGEIIALNLSLRSENKMPQNAPGKSEAREKQAEPAPADVNEPEPIAPGKKNPREAVPAKPESEARGKVVIVPEMQEEYYEKGLATVTMSELRDGKGAHDQLEYDENDNFIQTLENAGKEDVSFVEAMKNIDSDEASKITDITVLHQLIRAADEYNGEEQGLTGDALKLKEFLEKEKEDGGIKGHEDHLFITSAVSAQIQEAYYKTHGEANKDGVITREEHKLMVNDAIEAVAKAGLNLEGAVTVDKFNNKDDIAAPSGAVDYAQIARNNEREV